MPQHCARAGGRSFIYETGQLKTPFLNAGPDFRASERRFHPLVTVKRCIIVVRAASFWYSACHARTTYQRFHALQLPFPEGPFSDYRLQHFHGGEGVQFSKNLRKS
jgi:hypothetical protein